MHCIQNSKFNFFEVSKGILTNEEEEEFDEREKNQTTIARLLKQKKEKMKKPKKKRKRKRKTRTDPDLRGPARILITALAARPFPICLSRNEHFPSRVPLRLNSYK